MKPLKKYPVHLNTSIAYTGGCIDFDDEKIYISFKPLEQRRKDLKQLYNMRQPVDKLIIAVISHEEIHRVLKEFIDEKTSKAFDDYIKSILWWKKPKVTKKNIKDLIDYGMW